MPQPVDHPSRRQLGRLPHDPLRPVLQLGRYLAATTPAHPVTADYLAGVADWGMYDNDKFGVCGPTSLANQRKQVSAYLDQSEQSPTQDDVFDLYRRSGNPNFNPATGADDNGVVLADMLSAAVSGGLGGQKPLAYAAVNVEDIDELRAAIALFGSVIGGVTLDVAQDQQTDAHQPWDYVRRSREWGGHAVLIGAYTSQARAATVDLSVISWAEVIGTTDDFIARQLDEAYVVLWPEVLGSTEFEAGVDLSALAADYEALTGRPFPAIPDTPPAPPAPPVSPPVAPPVAPPASDAAFRAQLATFVGQAQAYLGATEGAGFPGARLPHRGA